MTCSLSASTMLALRPRLILFVVLCAAGTKTVQGAENNQTTLYEYPASTLYEYPGFLIMNITWIPGYSDLGSSAYLELYDLLYPELFVLFSEELNETRTIFRALTDMVFSKGSVKVGWKLVLNEPVSEPSRLSAAAGQVINETEALAGKVIEPLITSEDLSVVSTVFATIGAVTGLLSLVGLLVPVLKRMAKLVTKSDGGQKSANNSTANNQTEVNSEASPQGIYFPKGNSAASPQGTYFPKGNSAASPQGTYFPQGNSVVSPQGTYFAQGNSEASPQGTYFPKGNSAASPQGTYFPKGNSAASPQGTYFPQGNSVVSPQGTYFAQGNSVVSPQGTYFAQGNSEASPQGTYFAQGNSEASPQGTYFAQGNSEASPQGTNSPQPVTVFTCLPANYTAQY